MNHKRNHGFTLIEIAVVVFVIGIIASIILIAFNQVQIDTRDRRRTSDIVSLENALSGYYRDNNEFPPACGTGNDNSGCSASLLASSLVPKYIPAIPADPKGPQYSYVRGTNGTSFGFLISFETQPQCKAGYDASPGWWGSSVPICGAPL